MTDLYNLLKASKTGIAPDMFTAVISRKIGGYSIREFEAVPPLTFKSAGGKLLDYRIYGADGGVGDLNSITGKYDIVININGKNLCNNTGWEQGQYNNGVWYTVNTRACSGYIPVFSGTYTISLKSNSEASFININYFDKNKNWLGSRSTLGLPAFDLKSRKETFTLPENARFLRIVLRRYDAGNDRFSVDEASAQNLQVELGNKATAYEPYREIAGISISLDNPLYSGENISLAETSTEISTLNGCNTLSVGTEIQPEKIYIKYKGA